MHGAEDSRTPLLKRPDIAYMPSFRNLKQISPQSPSPMDPKHKKFIDFKKMRSYVQDPANPSLEQTVNFNFSQYRKQIDHSSVSKTIELSKTCMPNLNPAQAGPYDSYQNGTP